MIIIIRFHTVKIMTCLLCVAKYVNSDIRLIYHVFGLINPDVWIVITLVELTMLIFYRKMGPAIALLFPILGADFISHHPVHWLLLFQVYLDTFQVHSSLLPLYFR